MKWARQQAGYETAKNAADRLQISDVTLRSYEKPIDNAGRWPRSFLLLQRIAGLYGVDWVWLHTGTGEPKSMRPPLGFDQFLAEAKSCVERIPAEKRNDALKAALSVLKSFDVG